MSIKQKVNFRKVIGLVMKTLEMHGESSKEWRVNKRKIEFGSSAYVTVGGMSTEQTSPLQITVVTVQHTNKTII